MSDEADEAEADQGIDLAADGHLELAQHGKHRRSPLKG